MRICLLAALVGLNACAHGHSVATPDERYISALQSKFAGDAKGYYDALLALADQEPHSRAGRRARATLGGSDWLASLALLSAAGVFFLPSYLGPSRMALQNEAKQGLTAIAEAQTRYFAVHHRYCSTSIQCELNLAPGKYFFFLRDDEALGDVAPSRRSLAEAARAALRQHQVRPHADKTTFLAAAVSNLDGDAEVDLWTIDEHRRLVQVHDDVD